MLPELLFGMGLGASVVFGLGLLMFLQEGRHCVLGRGISTGWLRPTFLLELSLEGSWLKPDKLGSP